MVLQATVSSDNCLRIYECLEQPSLTSWQLSEEVDVLTVPSASSPSFLSRTHSVALATPTQTSASLEAPSASLVAQALLQQGIQPGTQTTQSRPGLGNREADGGWCLSWCKDRYWGEIIAVGCSINGVIKVSSPSHTLLTLLIHSCNCRSSNSHPRDAQRPSSPSTQPQPPVSHSLTLPHPVLHQQAQSPNSPPHTPSPR